MAYVPLSKSAPRVGGYVPLSKSPAPAVSTAPGLQGETATSLLGSSAVVAKPSTQAIPDSTTGRGLGGFLKDLAQGTLRDFVAAGIAVGNDIKKSTIGGTLDPKDLGILGPTLLGSEPVRGLTDTAADYQRSLEQTPLKKGATPLAILGSVAPTALDFLGLGGETKGATALFKALKATDATAEGEAKAFGILRGAGFSEDVANQYAKVVADSKDLDAIKTAIMAAKKLQETTIEAGAKSTTRAYVPLAEQAKSVAENIPGVSVAAENTPIEIKVSRTTAPEVQALAEEAKKYKTADEFTKAVNAAIGQSKENGSDLLRGLEYLNKGRARLPETASTEVKLAQHNGRLRSFYNEVNVSSTGITSRINTKLEKMAASSPTFGEFYSKSGVTLEALNATARNKGYANAAEFYAKNAARTGYETVPGKGGVRILMGHDAEMASLERAAQMHNTPDNLPELPRRSPTSLGEETAAAKQALEEARTQRNIGRDVIPDMPGADVRKYESSQTGDLPEVTGKEYTSRGGKKVKNSAFGRSGDVIVQEFGFKDVDEAQEALNDYKKARQQLNAAEASVSARVKDYRDRKAVFDEVVRYVNQEGSARREKVKMVQDFFKLTDGEVKSLLKGERDVRLMTDGEFNDFLKRFEGKSTETYLRMQDLVDLKATIFDKEFVKLDNLRQAMKLPTIENMTPLQMQQFNAALKEFNVGDEFLGVRQLETIKNTTLDGIHTIREARERLLMDINLQRARKSLPPLKSADLDSIKTTWMDHFRYDVALARRNPLYDLMVHETHKSLLGADMEVLQVKDKVNELFNAARASRSRSILDKLIPTDKRIFKWLEAPDAQKIILAQDMTHEELEAAMYVRAWYAEARDYLVQQGTLKRYISDYITHVRRGFLEGWYESTKSYKAVVSGEKAPGLAKRTGKGLLAAAKEMFAAYKQDEAFFNIMNDKTGEVLPLEKFFQFSLKRSGELIPTQNAASAFLRYVATFEKKKALDNLIPKLDIYVHSLTPKKLTPRGLEFDDSLKTFFKQWMNTKKGRVMALGPLKPGNPLDWALRTGVALTRFIDLGLSIPVGIASNLGAQASVYRGLGEKAYALGQARLLSKKGAEIADKYQNLVGESVYSKMKSADATLGSNIMSGVFGLFSFADRKARQVYLLGSMTPEEFKAGEVSKDRLADIALDLGRHMPVENMQSTFGKTSVGKVGSQYRTWAVPLLSSTLDDLSKMATAVRSGDSSYLKSKEFKELLRTTLLSTIVGLGVYGTVNDSTPMKDKNFVEKLTTKAAQDALSLVGALDPQFWLSPPRLLQFLGDLGTGIHQIVTAETNKDGELTGVNTLERAVEPGALKQAIPPAPDTSGGGLPGLPKLPKIGGGLPKLPKLGR